MKGRQAIQIVLCALLCIAMAQPALALAFMKWGDDKNLYFTPVIKFSFTAAEHGAPNGSDSSKDFALESARFYTGGQVSQYVYWDFNTEYQHAPTEGIILSGKQTGPGETSEARLRVLDASVKFRYSDALNLWVGRLVLPTDRADHSGPYGGATFEVPAGIAWPSVFAERDDGATVWGGSTLAGVQIRYWAGVYDGQATANGKDTEKYAARITLNFWDPESCDPYVGYYNASTYYGAKKILSVGANVMQQNDVTGTAADPSNFLGWAADALMDGQLFNVPGVITLEGGYYKYDLDNEALLEPDITFRGHAWYVNAAYMFPKKLGIGQIRPNLQYNSITIDSGPHLIKWHAGFDYVIDGNNAKISILYGQNDLISDGAKFFKVGLQVQAL